MSKLFLNWSGGKDCTMALFKLLEQKQSVDFLFTTLSKETNRVSMHGTSKELITRQAMSLGIHSRKLYLPVEMNMEVYNKHLLHEMKLMQAREINTAVFGDVFLEDLKEYREKQLASIGMKAVFPLWKRDTRELITEFIDRGFKAVIVCVNAKKLNKSFIGRTIDKDFVNELPDDVDVCGENGEYHSFVYDGPIFNKKINFELSETVRKHYASVDGGHDSEFYFLNIKHI
ncbi:MAG: diphthine--ammonia ligase [Bacteroidota bacterium]|nr:diphthine--ammonia ligase [Bacteroidota bacterium]